VSQNAHLPPLCRIDAIQKHQMMRQSPLEPPHLVAKKRADGRTRTDDRPFTKWPETPQDPVTARHLPLVLAIMCALRDRAAPIGASIACPWRALRIMGVTADQDHQDNDESGRACSSPSAPCACLLRGTPHTVGRQPPGGDRVRALLRLGGAPSILKARMTVLSAECRQRICIVSTPSGPRRSSPPGQAGVPCDCSTFAPAPQ